MSTAERPKAANLFALISTRVPPIDLDRQTAAAVLPAVETATTTTVVYVGTSLMSATLAEVEKTVTATTTT